MPVAALPVPIHGRTDNQLANQADAMPASSFSRVAGAGGGEPDYDSSCSSITTPTDSAHGWISDFSFGSTSSLRSLAPYRPAGMAAPASPSSSTTSSSSCRSAAKPHRANQLDWEAMRRHLRREGGRVELDQFQLLRRLGSGDIGSVYLCRLRKQPAAEGRKPECFYAMKVVDREALAARKKLQRAEMEREILAMLDHPFLPTLYAAFDASHYSCIVIDFCPGGDLHALRHRQPHNRFSIVAAKFYAAEVILALEYLHMMGIIYRDLKPENVLIREDGHIMLSDFDLSFKCDVVPRLIRLWTPPDSARSTSLDGKPAYKPHCYCKSSGRCAAPIPPVLSCFSASNQKKKKKRKSQEEKNPAPAAEIPREMETELVAEPVDARSKSFVGTHEYLAPEVISGQGHGSAVDWWTLGVFLFELLFGRTPFRGENNERTLINILKQPLTFPRTAASCVAGGKDAEEIGNAQDLICKLLARNPRKRIGSVKGSAEIKRHEFFRGVNWALIRSVKPPKVAAAETAGGSCSEKAGRKLKPPSSSERRSGRDAAYQIPGYVHYF